MHIASTLPSQVLGRARRLGKVNVSGSCRKGLECSTDSIFIKNIGQFAATKYRQVALYI